MIYAFENMDKFKFNRFLWSDHIKIWYHVVKTIHFQSLDALVKNYKTHDFWSFGFFSFSFLFFFLLGVGHVQWFGSSLWMAYHCFWIIKYFFKKLKFSVWSNSPSIHTQPKIPEPISSPTPVLMRYGMVPYAIPYHVSVRCGVPVRYRYATKSSFLIFLVEFDFKFFFIIF